MLYNSIRCIHGHIQRLMQHNFLFPKVASPSQCASLWRDVRHIHVCWLCWQIFRTFQAWNMLWHPASRVTKSIQNVTNLPFDTKLPTGHTGCQLQSDGIPDSKITHQHTGASQVHTLDTVLWCVVEDMKTILYWWEMSTRWHMMSETIVNLRIREKLHHRKPIDN